MPFDTLWIGTSWKMNKLRAEARAFVEALKASDLARSTPAQLFIIPPFTAVAEVAQLLAGTRVRVGVQNVHWAEAGAWTGEISAAMAADCGATIAEIGHSERREFFGETDETVALKVAAALRHGLTPLVCVGDTRAEYEAGRTAEVLEGQVRAAVSKVSRAEAERVVIAYEPVWSIGEGGTPADPGFADDQHARIKAVLTEVVGREPRVLYGGSVNPGNCAELASRPNIDGLFIGRSAWAPEGFLGIVGQVSPA
ncbi:triose-phosphate isomerase [Lichenibacterium dinghuense]|uniref:triose-phosphate isomerase n=1 Tax=Lichenibacterium dinghuense TaxID=2895977 RepID=UPI001F006B85|nr:triose-phosphate isomerase [Lichenibacterium sp. 6Y81]